MWNLGDIVETYTYDVYGKPTILDANRSTLNASAISNPYMFTGRRYDEESGLYYYRARYYSPEIGRFVSRDPYTCGPDDARNIKINMNTPSSMRRMPDFANTLPVLAIAIKVTNPFVYLDSLFTPDIENFLSISSSSLTGAGKFNARMLHLYLYCLNNPNNYIDPYGFIIGAADPIVAAGLIGLGVASAAFLEAPIIGTVLIIGGVAVLIFNPITACFQARLEKAARNVMKKYLDNYYRGLLP